MEIITSNMLLSDYDTLKNVKNGYFLLILAASFSIIWNVSGGVCAHSREILKSVLKEFLCQMSVCNEITFELSDRRAACQLGNMPDVAASD